MDVGGIVLAVLIVATGWLMACAAVYAWILYGMRSR